MEERLEQVEEQSVFQKIRSKFKEQSPSVRKAVFSGGALILLFIGFSLANPLFMSSGNLINILQQVVTYAILGYGLTFTLVAGGTDLSAGAFLYH